MRNRQLLNISFHLVCAFFLAILYSLLLITLGQFIAFFFLVLAPLTLGFYYYLTTKFYTLLTIIHFFINFILWTIELVYLDRNFHDTVLYQHQSLFFLTYFLFGLLWTINKLFIYFLFGLFNPKTLMTTKLEDLFRVSKGG